MKLNSTSNSHRRQVRPRLRRTIRWFVALRGSPEAIAGGVAIGMFVAFTPTIGFQMVIAALLATLLKANRPAAIAMVWLTNPLTVPPVFMATYWVGTFFRAGPPAAEVYTLLTDTMRELHSCDYWALYDQFTAFVAVGWHILIPLLIGGLVMGTVLGSISYIATLGAVKRYRRLRGKRKRQPTRKDGT
ncbi:MAG: DUF2062 domain-containing protein [Planctomycetota bacterium]